MWQRPRRNLWGILLRYAIIVAATILGISVLIAILFPPLIGERRSKRALCGSHLRSLWTAFSEYAAANSDALPSSNVKLSSLCEQSVGARDAIIDAAQSPRTMGNLSVSSVRKWMYCPANGAQYQNWDALWDAGGVSTWGYVWMNDRGAVAGMPATLPARKVPLEYFSHFHAAANASEAILALDVVVTGGETAPLNYAPKGTAVPFGTNYHPAGPTNMVNVVHPDGSVESMRFDVKTAVAVKQPGGGYFWFPGP
jgi:hypothetical protein